MEEKRNKRGRPPVMIDQEQFESLCEIQCTEAEICKVLKTTDKTLNGWCQKTYKTNFSEIFAQKREGGKASLRRMQWKLAEKNATMAIFLGKQYLGQRDVIEERVDAGESTIEQIAKMIMGEKKDDN